MGEADRTRAQAQVARAMLQDHSWRDAVHEAGIQMSRATAYRLRQRMVADGEDALRERRQGQPTKVCGAVRAWLEGYYQHHPRAPGKAVQALLEKQCGVQVSVTHLHRVRAALTRATVRGKNQPGAWQDGAGGLLLLAAAVESNLLPTLEAALPTQEDVTPPRRLARSTPRTRRQALLTLLVLGVVGLHRPWDLRGYAQEGLALLTTRRRAYGYRTIERFLSQVAQAGGAEPFTDALARWTTRLWKPGPVESQSILPPYFLDGHRKPVFSDSLLPRGVIGRTGKILGCRTLLLLHDEQGHPLLETTHRGDLHLALGAPTLIICLFFSGHVRYTSFQRLIRTRALIPSHREISSCPSIQGV